ncbi:hypothetical protein BDN72DRAFT_825131 [Pluteus cervinus]|uniref:Uncharacterized protein n=1 Tax=Pluteus cervinus TaxID=181527 RepID=A0ACD3AH58_9AGAR|nr:hypothetical protein BDN72DRAFT_825131 [Pluteus cervinus]
MYFTLVCRARAHQPLIKFLGKHGPPLALRPGPHPAAPLEMREQFSAIISKRTETESSVGGNVASYSEYWQAPRRLWQSRDISEAEIKAILSGGATAW